MAYFVGSLIGSFIAGWIWVRIARLAAPASAKARWVFLIALAIPSAGVLIPDTSNAERVEMWLMHFLSVAFWSRRYRASLGEKSDAPTLPPTDEDTNPSRRGIVNARGVPVVFAGQRAGGEVLQEVRCLARPRGVPIVLTQERLGRQVLRGVRCRPGEVSVVHATAVSNISNRIGP